ncbi:MAG: 2-oxo acid dehydrogenase subunit E2 [Chloroflexi bacterium]|nr:2-oxo acid dehydrogenase subunit E2 [Chloroflexota bacterium]
MGLREIAGAISSLAERARQRSLSPSDVKDGTFTVTNSGVFGSTFFVPLLNLPQACILGLGTIRKVPVVRQDSVVVGHSMFLCLSYDHRLIDGGPAVRFLRLIRDKLEDPAGLAARVPGPAVIRGVDADQDAPAEGIGIP